MHRVPLITTLISMSSAQGLTYNDFDFNDRDPLIKTLISMSSAQGPTYNDFDFNEQCTGSYL